MLGDMHLRVAVATTVGDDQQGASDRHLSSVRVHANLIPESQLSAI
jgi:hypothetical protein